MHTPMDRNRNLRRVLQWVAGLLVVLVVATMAPVPASAVDTQPEPGEPPETDPPPTPPTDPASFDWSMPDRFGMDSNGDGLIDYYAPSDHCEADDPTMCSTLPPTSPYQISPGTWHADLDACASTLAAGTNPTFQFQVLRGPGAVISGGPGCRDFDLTVPAEGVYRLRLTVTSSLGTATVEKDVVVQDWLIVSLGDSYGSGEGNPDIDAQHDSFGFVSAGAKWQDRRCHRSANAGSAQAARSIERADKHTSVTFIHIACSGALATTGLLQAYGGTDNEWEAKDMPPIEPQLTEARELVGNREVDALYISIGGNDANFGPIVQSCIALEPCNPVYTGLPDAPIPDVLLAARVCQVLLLIPPPFGEIAAGLCTVAISVVMSLVGGQTAEHYLHDGLIGDGTPGVIPSYKLSQTYDRLEQAIHATAPGPAPNNDAYLGLPASDDNRVFMSEYVDATTDDDGSYCPKNNLFAPLNDVRVPGLSEVEYQWIDLEVERKLNEVVGSNAQKNGWNFVDGIHDRFVGHGICADDPYMVGMLGETFWRQDNIKGTAHPNLNGHRVYRDRILSKLLPSLYPGPGAPDNFTFQTERDWIAEHPARLPRQAPVADAGGPYTVNEGSTVTATNGSYDTNSDALTYSWSSDNTGVATVSSASAATPTITGVNNGQATLTLRVSDDGGAHWASSATATVTVSNVAPTVNAVVAPVAPVKLGTAITASSGFTDPGTADAHTVTWSWGDGTTTPQQKNAGVTGAISATHTYAAAGLYTVSVAVDDKDGGVTSQQFQYVTVYDASGGFVVGGGTLVSPAGALAANPTATGQATFAFESKYAKGATVPTGNTQFRFNAGDFAVSSTSYDWLVVSGGSRAQYKGTAPVNGQSGYGFMLTAVDGTPDRLRIKVWRLSDNTVVYDNQAGATDSAALTTVITGGQITVSAR